MSRGAELAAAMRALLGPAPQDGEMRDTVMKALYVACARRGFKGAPLSLLGSSNGGESFGTELTFKGYANMFSLTAGCRQRQSPGDAERKDAQSFAKGLQGCDWTLMQSLWSWHSSSWSMGGSHRSRRAFEVGCARGGKPREPGAGQGSPWQGPWVYAVDQGRCFCSRRCVRHSSGGDGRSATTVAVMSRLPKGLWRILRTRLPAHS